MNTVQQLTEVFSDNFVAYIRSHIAHLNVTGRNFSEDHELLGDIYADLQGQIDMIGELIRSLGEFVPDNIDQIVDGSSVIPLPMMGSADNMLADVKGDLEQLRRCYEELIAVADSEGRLEISNYAQDRVLSLSKSIWMLDATLA